MSLFKKKQEKQPIDIASILAISSLTPFLDKHPELSELLRANAFSLEEWDYLMTVAIFGSYLIINKKGGEASKYLDDEKKKKIVEDFLSFVEKESVEKKASAGLWFLWNLIEREPSDEKGRALIIPIGDYIFEMARQI
ncbi:MAG: hypothetical protein M1355_04435 [Patescibacteria group bacterium]|nr:hypothetical protein [Patescibacteria group bacterium]